MEKVPLPVVLVRWFLRRFDVSTTEDEFIIGIFDYDVDSEIMDAAATTAEQQLPEVLDRRQRPMEQQLSFGVHNDDVFVDVRAVDNEILRHFNILEK